MIYLTFNDAPGGIYYSQVTDVIKFLRKEFKLNLRLVAFISLRGFISNRKKIKNEEATAIVIPMFPKVELWKWNLPLVFFASLFFDFNQVISRGPYATYLALFLKKLKRTNKVCFDARGAYDAEFNEYNIIDNIKIKKEIKFIEKKALSESNYHIAVSHQLVNYWKEKYKYETIYHVVIPCTLNSNGFSNYPDEKMIKNIRESLYLKDSDIVLVYSGSSSGWQSLEMVDRLLLKLMDNNPDIKVIIMVETLSKELNILKKYSNRVIHKWVKPQEVNQTLLAADYGILIREKSITNKVSSPTKFAEYLSSGLSILISDEIGDYTKFVEEYNCGFIIKDENIPLKPKTYEEKKITHLLAIEHFTKMAHKKSYNRLISALK